MLQILRSYTKNYRNFAKLAIVSFTFQTLYLSYYQSNKFYKKFLNPPEICI